MFDHTVGTALDRALLGLSCPGANSRVMRTYSELKELGPTCSLIHLATKTNVGIHPKNAPTVKATAIPKNSSHEPQDLTGFLTS